MEQGQRPGESEPGAAHHRVAPRRVRPQRADGRRNQTRVLEAAFAAFAEHGSSVPVREIARRAGVSTGTVSRHYPTKDALFRAVVLHRVGQLVHQAEEITARADPGTAFFAFFAVLVRESAADQAVADALSDAGFDIPAAAAAGGQDFGAALRGLLTRAQQAGAVRDDVDTADLKALVAGCVARESAPHDDDAQQRMIEIACQGLRVCPD